MERIEIFVGRQQRRARRHRRGRDPQIVLAQHAPAPAAVFGYLNVAVEHVREGQRDRP
jgi:hypothetical protein